MKFVMEKKMKILKVSEKEKKKYKLILLTIKDSNQREKI